MSNQGKITAHPPQKAIHEFILEADKKNRQITETSRNSKFPWEANGVRDDVQKAFTIKLPEPYMLKIKYISEQTNKSQQKIAREILLKEIDQILVSILS
jgi:hypothetical protein